MTRVRAARVELIGFSLCRIASGRLFTTEPRHVGKLTSTHTPATVSERIYHLSHFGHVNFAFQDYPIAGVCMVSSITI